MPSLRVLLGGAYTAHALRSWIVLAMYSTAMYCMLLAVYLRTAYPECRSSQCIALAGGGTARTMLVEEACMIRYRQHIMHVLVCSTALHSACY